MGNIKSKQRKKGYILTEREYNYLKILNLALQYNVLKDKAISGFLYYVCNARFGFKEDQNLLFEVDLEDDKRELKIQVVPTEDIANALDNGK